jgi:hypothetical protein
VLEGEGVDQETDLGRECQEGRVLHDALGLGLGLDDVGGHCL